MAVSAVLSSAVVEAAPALSQSNADKLPKQVQSEIAVSCPPGVAIARSTCAFAVNDQDYSDAIVYVVKGKPSAPKPLDSLFGHVISCPTQTLCVVTTSSAVEWLSNGKVVATVGVKNLNSPSGVSCPTASYCVEFGSQANGSKERGAVALVHRSDHSVTAKAVPNTQGGVLDVACVSASTCYGVGNTAINQSSHGVYFVVTTAVGSVRKIKGVESAQSISCMSASACAVAGEHFTSSGTAGRVVFLAKTKVVKVMSVEPLNEPAIICPSKGNCLVSDPSVYSNGRSSSDIWLLHNRRVKHKLVLKAGYLVGTCPTASRCIDLGPGRKYAYLSS